VKQTKLLIILDGWGHSEKVEHNAIKQANTPIFDNLIANYPHTLINTSGETVGLIGNQMGNSEVGHLNLGAGRVVKQDLSRINAEIQTGGFFHNPILKNQLEYVKINDKSLHIIGLLSDGGVHSNIEHIFAMLEMAKQFELKKVYVHIFTDGRDCPPKSAKQYIQQLEEKMSKLGVGRIATMIGRYFAMDRDNRWDRTRKAFELIVRGKAEYNFNSAIEGIDYYYTDDITDEFIDASTIGEVVQIGKGDGLIFMNYRADRARQLTKSFVMQDFIGFSRGTFESVQFISLTEYKKDFNIPVAYPAMKLNNVLGAYLSKLGKTQLRIAETEKYAHVTFFLNGGVEEPFSGEDRMLIPSPDVPTYDLQPEMSAYELTDELVARITSGKYDLIICNYANTDMVGHSGKLKAAIKAVEAVDECLGKIIEATLKIDGEMLITADHGNAEKMWDTKTNAPHTAHTSNPVPLIFVGNNKNIKLMHKKDDALADIAPTLLKMMGIEQPKEMSGHSLIEE
jgi:2,3-bisphosphoglycerate-independent phosphoglycerate mutase